MIQLVGLGGSLCILSAFALVQARVLAQSSMSYLLLNVVGSVLLGWQATVTRQWAFLVLEVSWVGISVWGLVKSRRHTPAGQGCMDKEVCDVS